jgi:hypothetical protein
VTYVIHRRFGDFARLHSDCVRVAGNGAVIQALPAGGAKQFFSRNDDAVVQDRIAKFQALLDALLATHQTHSRLFAFLARDAQAPADK